ncbi:HET-domain-containing protein [Curvularia clavata]|uniref:HET-domain-containing protein n=1 Tax=Curvularia clavata TaxID=95742 RepID=A0A9Q9DXQ0_CURCL|nr:HET-domain-containing protein [Curvularia clavata]
MCINQENLDEKSWQVEMMGEIYQAAERVVIWLDDQHIRHSEMMDATVLLETINFISLDLPTDVYDPPSRVVGHCNHWQALSRLLSHPYWHRVWIIQEVAMAKNVHLLYGNRYIAWDHLVKMITCLVTYPVRVLPAVAHLTYGLDNSTFSGGAIQVLAIATLRNLVHRNEFTTLVECILFTKHSNATNPRDKIFALKNLVRQPSNSKLVPSIKIDYRLKVHDVYASVSRDLLETIPSFILSFAGIGWQRKTPGLPSWVPDFQSLPECTDEQNLNTDAKYSAGLPGSINIPVCAVSNGYLPAITVQAIFVSNVSCISPTKITIGETQIMSDTLTFTKTLYTEAWKIVQKMPSRYAATGQAKVEAFWRTLIEDRHVTEDTTNTQFKRPASPEYGTYFLARQDEFFTDEDLTTDMPWMKEATKNKTYEFKYKSSFNFSRAIGRVWQGRKFAVTENGLMGVVPPGAELGDMLCIVPGFERPVLLRKSPRPVLLSEEENNSYEFVGACYAHGIMDGELLKGVPSFKTFRVR